MERPEAALTGSDVSHVTGSDVSHVTGSDVIFPRLFSFCDIIFPRLFSSVTSFPPTFCTTVIVQVPWIPEVTPKG